MPQRALAKQVPPLVEKHWRGTALLRTVPYSGNTVATDSREIRATSGRKE
jgi:hypothetical protein